MYLYNFTLIFSLSFRILRPPSSTVTGYLFTSLSALCLSQSSYPCGDISTSDTHGIIRVRARQYTARNWPNLFILSWFPQRDGWSDWLSSAEEVKPGRWQGEERKGQHPTDDQLNSRVQLSLSESSRPEGCPSLSKLGWTIRASLMFSQGNPPTIVYFNPWLWTKWEKSLAKI